MARPLGDEAQDDQSAALDELLGDLLCDPAGDSAAAVRQASLRVPECDGAEKDAVQASPLSRSTEMRNLDEEMSREIAQLSKEMSACLASLNSWEEERQQRSSAYREALDEACRGPHEEELRLAGDDGPGCRPSSVDSPMGEDAQPEGGAWPGFLAEQGAGPDAGARAQGGRQASGGHGEADVRAVALAALARAEGEGALRADEERVRQLREEVELLRRAEEALDDGASAPWGTRTTLDDDDPVGPRDLPDPIGEAALVAAAVAAGPAPEQPSMGLLEDELSELLGECCAGAGRDAAGGTG